ncbi:MAG: ArsA family ATPase [Acidimicrobiales bacterium]
MDVAAFLRSSRVLVVAGKGGVGKTTIAAALARMACHAGLDVLLVELEGKTGVPSAFGHEGALDYEETVLADGRGQVRARRITPDDALLEYLADHGMRRISKRLVSSGALDVVSTAIPGIRDILVLGKVKSLEKEGRADLIIVDAPATGHAMTFLSSAKGLLDAARAGPVRTQAQDVVELLSDPARCQVALVTLPEEMPVNEVVEAAYALEDKIGICLGPVIVNGCIDEDPALERDPGAAAADAGIELTGRDIDTLGRAASFHVKRWRLQEQQLERLRQELPLAQIRARHVAGGSVGPDQLELLARDIASGIETLADAGPARTRQAEGAQGTTQP